MTSPRVIHPLPVLIAGGGIGGLAAAIALDRAGIPTAVYERAERFREVGAGVGMATNAVLALRELGVAAEAVAGGEEIERFDITDERGTLLSSIAAGPISRKYGAPSLCIHRAALLEVLERALPKDILHLGSAIESFSERLDGVEITLANGERVNGSLLVGADGLRSRVRELLFADGEPRYAGYTCWRGVAPRPERFVEKGRLIEMWGRGRRFGIVAIGNARTYWFATLDAPRGQRDDLSVKARLLEEFAGFSPFVHEILAATPHEAILRNDLFDREPLARCGRGRISLLGDAAHPMTPNLGQGACQALEDAVVLGRSLNSFGIGESALRDYESRRSRRTKLMVLESRRFGSVGQWRNRAACHIRNRLLRMMNERASARLEKLVANAML